MIIPGIQIGIPFAGAKAQKVISSMFITLALRHHHKITRGQFLARWTAHRKSLFLTEEYQALRVTVFDRQNGLCVVCQRRKCVHMHHIIRVVDNPQMALVPSNVQGMCRTCHHAQPHSPLHTRTLQFTNRDAPSQTNTQPPSTARSAATELIV